MSKSYVSISLIISVLVLMLSQKQTVAEGIRQSPLIQNGVSSFTNCQDVAAETAIPQIECEALVAFNDSTNVSTWFWMSSNNPCEWFGITCTDGQITTMEYSLNGITGTLPPQLGNLASLQTLEIRRNSLSGTIPSSLGNLTNLQFLNLERNQLTGEIPRSLGDLPNLLSLDLNENELNGSIPANLGSMTALQGLRLYQNQLTGEIPPELSLLTNLTSLRLHENDLSGALPPELGGMIQLTRLELTNNENLTGSIPDEFATMMALTDFRYSNTMLCVVVGSTAESWLNNITTFLPPPCDTTPTAVAINSLNLREENFSISVALATLTILVSATVVMVHEIKF